MTSCQYEAYSARYDGLALGHYLDLTMVTTALAPTTGDGADVTYYTVVCDGDTLHCWGWSLLAEYTMGEHHEAVAADTISDPVTEAVDEYWEEGSFEYSSKFYSGSGYVELSTSLPSAANFDTALWANLESMETFSAATAYGFRNVYWMGEDDSTAWPSETLVYRF